MKTPDIICMANSLLNEVDESAGSSSTSTLNEENHFCDLLQQETVNGPLKNCSW